MPSADIETGVVGELARLNRTDRFGEGSFPVELINTEMSATTVPIRKTRIMFGRIPIHDVRSLDDVTAFIESSDGPKVIIFDVDNTLAPQGVPIDEFGVMVNAAIDRFEANRHVGRVIALTNGPQRGVERMECRGNKPWTTRRRLGLRPNGAPVVVVGDQVLTDGLLAWRLRATFLHLVIDDEKEDRRQANMRRIGGVVMRAFFSRM